MNARRIQIVGALFLTVLSVPSLCAQSSKPDPWVDFPSFDQTIVWYLRRGADAKAGKRLAQDAASVDTFRRLVAAERRDDALIELKRIVEASDSAQTIAALHALSETIYMFRHDQTRSYTETIRQTIAPARARIAQLPREDAARFGSRTGGSRKARLRLLTSATSPKLPTNVLNGRVSVVGNL